MIADDNLRSKLPACEASWKAPICKDCGTEMEEIYEENLYVPCNGYFRTKDGKIVSLYVCPKCGRVQGEFFKKNDIA